MGGLLHLEEQGEAWAAQPSPLLTVPNVRAHPSMATVPTSYYLMWHYNCHCPLKGYFLPRCDKVMFSVTWVCYNVYNFVYLLAKVLKNSSPISVKLSELMGNGTENMLLNSPCGSTLQWVMEQGVLCPVPLVLFYIRCVMFSCVCIFHFLVINSAHHCSCYNNCIRLCTLHILCGSANLYDFLSLIFLYICLLIFSKILFTLCLAFRWSAFDIQNCCFVFDITRVKHCVFHLS